MREGKKRDDAKENQGAGKYDGEQLTDKTPQSESQPAHDSDIHHKNIAVLKVNLLEGEDYGMLQIENVT